MGFCIFENFFLTFGIFCIKGTTYEENKNVFSQVIIFNQFPGSFQAVIWS